MAEEIKILIDGATNILDLTKFRNKLKPKGDPEEYPNDAIVVLKSLKKPDGTPIVGTVDLPMNYVDGTTGKKTRYRAILPNTIDLTVGDLCVAEFLASAAGGVRPFFRTCKVEKG